MWKSNHWQVFFCFFLPSQGNQSCQNKKTWKQMNGCWLPSNKVESLEDLDHQLILVFEVESYSKAVYLSICKRKWQSSCWKNHSGIKIGSAWKRSRNFGKIHIELMQQTRDIYKGDRPLSITLVWYSSLIKFSFNKSLYLIVTEIPKYLNLYFPILNS